MSDYLRPPKWPPPRLLLPPIERLPELIDRLPELIDRLPELIERLPIEREEPKLLPDGRCIVDMLRVLRIDDDADPKRLLLD